jgi:hypothetical protein
VSQQPDVEHCPYCGHRPLVRIAGGDYEKEKLAHCQRCRRAFSVSLIETGGKEPETTPPGSTFEWWKSGR